VTDGEQQRAAELAKAIFRAVQQYLAGARTEDGGATSAASQLGEAMGLGMGEVIAAVQDRAGWPSAATLFGGGTLAAGGHVTAAATLSGERTLRVAADEIHVEEDASVVRLEDIHLLSARASRDGIGGFSPVQVLALVFLWLLALGGPVGQQALPLDVQAVLSNEYGTIGVALALTLVIVGRKR
jgi:hypothetical protein